MYKTMKAAVVSGIESFAIQQTETPQPKGSEVLAKVKAAGLCMTDIHIMKGKIHHADFPCFLGHEIAGEVAFIPEHIKEACSLKEGDRVVVETAVGCMACEKCLNGFKNLCYNGGEHVCPVGGLDRIGISMGDTVLIQGMGPAGLAFVQGAKAFGAKKIMVSSLDKFRSSLAKKYGADVCIDPFTENVEEVIMENTNGLGVNVSIEASGSQFAIENSIKLCKKNGKVVFYGIPEDNHNARFDVAQIIYKQLSIYGTSGTPWAWKPALDLYENGVFSLKDMVSCTFPIKEINQAIESVLDQSNNIIKAVILP